VTDQGEKAVVEESTQQRLGKIDYESSCQAVILNLLRDLQSQYQDESKRDDASIIHFTQGTRLLRATLACLKLGPNWKKLSELRKQLDEMQAEVTRQKAGPEA
jgi:hypothetical protein